MKLVYYKLLLITLLITLPIISIYATGPSYIHVGIRPISVNAKGEVLCRTRFVKNETGAHWYMPTEYGLYILKNKQLIKLKTKQLDPSLMIDIEDQKTKNKLTEEEYQKTGQDYDSIFNSNFDLEKLTKEEKVICKQYGFRTANVDKYKVDKIYPISKFETERKTNLQKNNQTTLRKAHSTTYIKDKIHVLYDFGNIVILDNKYSEDDESDIGAYFDYVNPMFGGMDYEYFQITGVLFLK